MVNPCIFIEETDVFLSEMNFNKSVDATAVHLLKGMQGDIVRLPGVVYLDCCTNLALQVRDLY